MNTVLSFLFAVTVCSAVQVNYVAPSPVASGYIYRNDYNGPSSLIQLGAVPYQHPQQFAPLKVEEVADLEPVPLPYVAAKPIIVEDSEDDDDDSNESSEEDDGDVNEAGSEYGEKEFAAHGETGSKGYNTKDYNAEGESGQYGKEHNEGFHNEDGGENESHNDESDEHGKHYEVGDHYEGGDHGHKKHFSKGEDTTGYHKLFHKDEFKKDHHFYDVADNSGKFEKHSAGNEKHGYLKGGHKEGGSHNSGFHKGGFGKAGYHSNGLVDDAALRHAEEEAEESHYKHHEDSGENGGSGHEKQYVYGDHDDKDDN